MGKGVWVDVMSNLVGEIQYMWHYTNSVWVRPSKL